MKDVDDLTGPVTQEGKNDEDIIFPEKPDAGVDMAERGLLGGYGVPQCCRQTDKTESK